MKNEFDNLSDEQLQEKKKELLDWLESNSNDGRLSFGSSAQLDYVCDSLHDINAILNLRALEKGNIC